MSRKARHSGETLTPKQKEWVRRVRLASMERPRSLCAGAIYLGISANTLYKWVWFFTGSKDWPAMIPAYFDNLPVVELSFERETKLATPEECQQLKNQVMGWCVRMQLPLAELAKRTAISESHLRTLVETGEITARSAKLLAPSFRSNKIWAKTIMSDAEIERRKAEVERQRRERERELLEQERVRYKLEKQFKPLSRMLV